MTLGTVLAIDDNPQNLKLIRVLLQGAGFKVRTASNAVDAIALVDALQPALILMDIQMPGMDGLTLTKKLKSDPGTRDITIIALTAYAMKGDKERILAAGCDGYIAKPIDTRTFADSISRYMRGDGLKPDPPQLTVLIVEDNATTRRMYRAVLEAENYHVIEAADGASGFAALLSSKPDLIVQDLILPDDDGFKLVAAFRATPNGADVPIIAVSGFLSHLEEGEFQRLGFSDYLFKPVSPGTLTASVNALLRVGRMGSAHAAGGQRILLVDDNPLQLKLQRIQLEQLGYQVTPAMDGQDALEKALDSPPDIVVSDVLMPRLDGFRLASAVRREPSLAKIPVLLVSTAFVTEEDRELALQAGAEDLVVHTPDSREIITALLEALESGATGPPGAPIELTEGYLHRIIRQLETQVSTNVMLSRRLAQQEAEFSILSALAASIRQETSVEWILREVFSSCLDAAGVSKGAAWLADSQGKLSLKILFGYPESQRAVVESFFGEPALLEQVADGAGTLIIPGAELATDLAVSLCERAGALSLMAVPLGVDKRRLGVILMASSSGLVASEWAPFADTVGSQLSQVIEFSRASSNLQESEERFRQMADAIDEVFWMSKADFSQVLYLSPAFEKIWGRSRDSEHATSQAWMSSIHPADVPRVSAEVASRSDLNQLELEYRIVRPDGTIRWIQDRFFAIRNKAGEIYRYCGTLKDITERKSHELDIHFKNFLLTTLLETSLDGILVVGEDSRILFSNRQFATVFGIPQETIDGGLDGLVLETAMSKLADPQAFLSKVQYLYEHREETSRDELELRDGRFLDRYSAPMFGPAGEYSGRVWFFRDVTQDKRAEKEILQLNAVLDVRVSERTAQLADANAKFASAREEADRANNAKSQFLSRMSRELRTPLNATLGFAQVLRRGNLDVRQTECVENILTAGKHLLQLINEVLDISRIEAGQILNDPKTISVQHLARETMDLVRPIAEARGVTLLPLNEGAEPATIFADPRRLKQILVNLLSNAIKYNREGGTVTLAWAPAANAMVRFRISDTGEGISREQVARLFTPFERLDAGLKAIEGTGLGLAVCRQLATAMGGIIGVDSEVGAGSTFWLEIPIGNGSEP
ncbi:hypothetical protein BH09SUM1_BH09SUM1_21300 [soil metagenome]